MTKQKKSSKKAFSLIELAIVVVVLGVLIAGVTKVNSLISLSETRATQITENPYKPSIPSKNLVAWFSADSKSNIEEDSGKVIKWIDLSGEGNDAVVFNNSGADHDGPVYDASGANGKPALYFNPGYLKFDASAIKTGDHTIFFVEHSDPFATGRNTDLFSFFHSTGNKIYFNNNTDRPILQRPGFVGAIEVLANFPLASGGTGSVVGNPVFQTKTADTRLITYVIEGDDNNVFFNGSDQVEPNGNPTGWTTPAGDYAVIGGSGSSLSAPATASAYDGYMAEVIIYSEALSSKNLETVHKYLKKKYSIGDMVCWQFSVANSDISCEDSDNS
jgi:prepilin-type N-terminal cleavage/methylation domain-containing protein